MLNLKHHTSQRLTNMHREQNNVGSMIIHIRLVNFGVKVV